MTDEIRLTAATSRAARAQVLQNDDLLKEAFDTLEAEYVKAWRESPARDAEGRQLLWQAVNVVGKVKDHLMKVVNDGKIAQAELNMRSEKRGKR